MATKHSDGEWTPDTMIRRGALWAHNYAAHYGGDYDYLNRSDLLRAARDLRRDLNSYILEIEDSRKLLGDLTL